MPDLIKNGNGESEVEIRNLAELEAFLLRAKLNEEQIIHWQNEESRQYLKPGQHLQESYLKVQGINGKVTVAHYDCDGRSMIPSMKELIEQTVGTKPIDVSALERMQALYNPAGFAAMQPELANQQERRDYARNKLTSLSPEQLSAMVAKATSSTAAAGFAKGKKYGGFFDKKQPAEQAAIENTFNVKPTKGN